MTFPSRRARASAGRVLRSIVERPVSGRLPDGTTVETGLCSPYCDQSFTTGELLVSHRVRCQSFWRWASDGLELAEVES